ncbi:uncharacterized protein [Solanum lycopersicum]|uniref:uncharacterized protein n=1 Tax=Solanum lycopersicum TaxID=4081 RepID=UPI003748D26F
MPPLIAVRGRPSRRNVEELDIPNAPNVQPQREVTDVAFPEVIRMLSQAMTHQIGKQRGSRQDSLIAHENGLKFTQLSRYAPEMVKNMMRRMSLFVAGLGRASSNEGKASMLIGDMDISRLMVYVQQAEKEKLRDRKEH